MKIVTGNEKNKTKTIMIIAAVVLCAVAIALPFILRGGEKDPGHTFSDVTVPTPTETTGEEEYLIGGGLKPDDFPEVTEEDLQIKDTPEPTETAPTRPGENGSLVGQEALDSIDKILEVGIETEVFNMNSLLDWFNRARGEELTLESLRKFNTENIDALRENRGLYVDEPYFKNFMKDELLRVRNEIVEVANNDPKYSEAFKAVILEGKTGRTDLPEYNDYGLPVYDWLAIAQKMVYYGGGVDIENIDTGIIPYRGIVFDGVYLLDPDSIDIITIEEQPDYEYFCVEFVMEDMFFEAFFTGEDGVMKLHDIHRKG